MPASPARRPRERRRSGTAPGAGSAAVRRPRRAGRVALLAGAGACVALLIAGLALRGGGRGPLGAAAPAATATIDPRLILHARTVPIVGVLSHGAHLSGTLYPAYPGRNTLRLTMQGGAEPPPRGGRLALSATMPGMAMTPIGATLAAHGRTYAGAIPLPMLGTYRVAVVAETSHGNATGVITLTLTLPGF